jgi:hypothetical protein
MSQWLIVERLEYKTPNPAMNRTVQQHAQRRRWTIRLLPSLASGHIPR